MRIFGSNLMTITLICILLLVKNANCECVNEYVKEKLYVSPDSYCWMTFYGCSNYVLTECSEVLCDSSGKDCTTISGIQNQNTCSNYCCQNLGIQQNNLNLLSYKFCTPSSS